MAARLASAARFVDGFVTMQTGNINYPVTSALALTLAGELLGERHYRGRGRELAHASLAYLTPGGLLFGEGHPQDGTTAKGCRAVDLGYNVEESLPALALYGLVAGDEEVTGRTVEALRAHLELMLPDGAWDNGWGTRQFKWTWWGSRTSDGCQPAYALLAARDPRFAEAAYRNLEQLAACTHDGLLHGGPHLHAARHPSVRAPLVHAREGARDGARPWRRRRTPVAAPPSAARRAFRPAPLPRDRDLARVRRRLARDGHRVRLGVQALGRRPPERRRALAALPPAARSRARREHDRVPAVGAAQPAASRRLADDAPDGPHRGRRRDEPQRLQGVRVGDGRDGAITFEASGRLQTTAHADPPGGAVGYRLAYRLTADAVLIEARSDTDARLVLPVVCTQQQPAERVRAQAVQLGRDGARLTIECAAPAAFEPLPERRVFNLVPGFQCVPIAVALPAGRGVRLTIRADAPLARLSGWRT